MRVSDPCKVSPAVSSGYRLFQAPSGEKLFSTIQSMVGSDDMAEVNEPGAGWMLTDDLEHEVLGLRTVKRAR